MSRPVMHTMLLDGVKPPPPPPSPWRHLLTPFRWGLAVLLFDLFNRGPKMKMEDGTLMARLTRALLYRGLLLLVFVAALLSGLVATLLWIGTHPQRAAYVYVAADPGSNGLYYEPLTFDGPEETQLEAWLVPLLDAKRVIEQGSNAVKRKQPAVVLVHDQWTNRTQMLPLVRPLHEAGFIVMIISVRGGAPVETGSTFGLAESEDVLSAVEVLRRQKGVDGSRIALLGTGTGANAVRVAARHDPAIGALVLDRPKDDVDGLVAEHLAPPQPWLAWLHPACKWAFGLAYKQNLDELGGALDQQSALVLGRDGRPSCFRQSGMVEARDFLMKRFGMEMPAQATTTEP
jgi:hypothetical protein